MSAGLHQVVVTSVRDMGEQPDKFNPGKTRRQVLVTFKNAAGDEASKWYTPSFHEKATYRKDMEAAYGGKVPDEVRIDIEAIKGLQCQILAAVKKNTKGYENATASNVLPPASGQNVVPAERAATSADDEDI